MEDTIHKEHRKEDVASEATVIMRDCIEVPTNVRVNWETKEVLENGQRVIYALEVFDDPRRKNIRAFRWKGVEWLCSRLKEVTSQSAVRDLLERKKVGQVDQQEEAERQAAESEAARNHSLQEETGLRRHAEEEEEQNPEEGMSLVERLKARQQRTNKVVSGLQAKTQKSKDLLAEQQAMMEDGEDMGDADFDDDEAAATTAFALFEAPDAPRLNALPPSAPDQRLFA